MIVDRLRDLRPAWVLGGLAGIAVGVVLWVVGAPSPSLFAGLIAGGVVARSSEVGLALPEWGRSFGPAVVGVAAGARVDGAVLDTIADHPGQIFGGVFATLVISMIVGQLLRLHPGVSGPTAVFASIAGGTSGVSVVADEFGADVATVLAIQYLRVVAVLLSMPLVAGLLGRDDGAAVVDHADRGMIAGLAFTVVALALGMLGGRLLHFSASGILVPLLVSSVLAVSGVFPSTTPPTPLVTFGYGVVGLGVGLGFTPRQARLLLRLLPLALLQIGLVVFLCALSGIALASATGVSRIDGYLATSPGGLPAVVAVALDTGGTVGFVLTSQVVRVLIGLLCAPAIGWWLGRRSTSPGGPDDALAGRRRRRN